MSQIGNSSASNARRIVDNFSTDNSFQNTGRALAEQLSKTEDDLIKQYELFSAQTDEAGRAAIQGTIQSMSIKLKRIESMMELFQQIVKSHFETLSRMIQNINLRS